MKTGRVKTVSREYVIDASVGIKLFIEEELADTAATLFGGLAAEPPTRLYVPDLFYIECANMLWKHVQRFEYPQDKARRDIHELVQLALESTNTELLAADALAISLEYKVTAYDSAYIALAKRLAVPLVTADEKLLKRMESSDHELIWLGDL